MRIQFGTWIHECRMVSNPGYGKTIGAETKNGYYTINFNTEKEAHIAYKQLLEKGYYDASNSAYIN